MANLPQIRIGTRKSALALVQAEEVKAKLQAAHKGLAVELVHITTSGDLFTDRPLSEIGGKGLFTKEIEDALLAKEVDIAVHSMKDMQTVLPDGLTIGCMLKRENPADVLIAQNNGGLDDLPKGATFGTASFRRAAQVLMLRPDLKIVPLRGNVQTRIDKIKSGEMQGTLLAQAGLNRLKLRVGTAIAIADILPAVGQGAIGIECREDDARTIELLQPLSDRDTEVAVHCERAFLETLDGSCRTPIAGYAHLKANILYFEGLIAKPDGSQHHRIKLEGDPGDAHAIGKKAGKELLAKAGKNFLA